MTAQLLLKAPDTSSRSWRHKSTQFFRRWFLVCVSCKSWTGFLWYQIPAPIRTLFYSKSGTGVHVTEIMTSDWSMIIVDVLRCRGVVLYSAVICLFIQYFQPCLFRCQKLSIQRQDIANCRPGNRVDLWQRFQERTSRALRWGHDTECVDAVIGWRLRAWVSHDIHHVPFLKQASEPTCWLAWNTHSLLNHSVSWLMLTKLNITTSKNNIRNLHHNATKLTTNSSK